MNRPRIFRNFFPALHRVNRYSREWTLIHANNCGCFDAGCTLQPRRCNVSR